MKKGKSEKRGRICGREEEGEKDLDLFNRITIFRVPSSLEGHMTELWKICEDFLISA